MNNKTWFLAAATALGTVAPLVALNSGNAGPKDFKIEFDLPPPKPLTAEEEAKTFKIEQGCRLELVASEPMIECPVAVSFDDRGGMYVVEMRSYMHDVESTGEQEPAGRISYLTDTDGDGKMDKAEVFLDKLILPRAVMACRGGALVAAPPNLYYCPDKNHDGKADEKILVDDAYGSQGGQPEHMANTPRWLMDNSIWSANHGTRYRWDGKNWIKGTGLGRGQWGLSQDDFGRPYFNYNSDLLRCDLLPATLLARNPLMRDVSSLNWEAVKDQTVWPSHPTPGVNRGYDKGSLRADGSLAKATAAGGAGIYRGDALPDFRGNAFVPEPAGNLVKRLTLTEENGVVSATSQPAEADFLTSTDERFRPVQISDGPDGALYIVDMYRGIIQHRGFLTHYLMANIEARKLSQPVTMGRIWRVVKDGDKRPAVVKIPEDTAGRVALLQSPSGWVRETVQRLLVEGQDPAAAPLLAAVAADAHSSNVAKIHALWTLDGLKALTPEIVKIALADTDPHVRAAAVEVAPLASFADLAAMDAESDLRVQAMLAARLSSSPLPQGAVTLRKMLVANGDNFLVREAALSGLRGRELEEARDLARDDTKAVRVVLKNLAQLIAASGKAEAIQGALAFAAEKDLAPAARDAFLSGLGPEKGDNSKIKTLWLDAEPPALALLKDPKMDKTAHENLKRLADRLAWPGKPGAPKPPMIVPMNAAQKVSFERGKALYAGICAACHQPHGYGLDGLAPPLVDSSWVLGDPSVPVRIVMQGLTGPIKVGARTWSLSMPPLGTLSDEDIAAVLTYIRREWEHDASPVSAAEVTKIREQYKDRQEFWTADELKAKER